MLLHARTRMFLCHIWSIDPFKFRDWNSVTRKARAAKRYSGVNKMEVNEEVSFPYTCPSLPGLTFQLAGPDDCPEMVEFLMVHFFPRCPPMEILEMDCEKEVRPWLPQFVSSVVASGWSIIVRDEGQLAAVRLNLLELKDSNIGMHELVDATNQPKMTIVLELLNQLSSSFNFYTMHNVDQVLHLVMVAVSEQFGRRGIASRLAQLSLRRARKEGIRVVVVEGANMFAAKLLLKNGFELVNQILYNDFEYKNSKPLTTTGIHQRIVLLSQTL